MSSPEVDTILSRLLDSDRPLPPLCPKKVYDQDLKKRIGKLPEHKFLVAILHLANDDIEGCHLIAQANETDPVADWLHATLHRREVGDFWNSKYWLRRLPASVHALYSSVESSMSFVDACEETNGTGTPREKECQQRQWDEIKKGIEYIRENCKGDTGGRGGDGLKRR